MRKITLIMLFVIRAAGGSWAWAASPCDGVDRSLPNERKAALAPQIAKQLAKQLDTAKVDVLESFQFRGWSIIYVDTHVSDETYLFYAHDPFTSRYITLWGGAAANFEETEIRNWTLKNAPGIPPKLASCFAWHVTKDRT
jgi:hypothetical protein